MAKLAQEASGIGDLSDDEEQRIFSTHPPTRDRIALARRFNGQPLLPPDPRPARVLIEPLIVKRDEPVQGVASS